MGKINLCIALSLDGYIADAKGSVDFVFENPRIDPDPDYKEFYNEIDIILFGSETYRQITEEISPDKWSYEGKRCYVFSNKQTGNNGQVEFTSLSPANFVKQISSKTEGTTWLFGGQKLVHSFMKENLIDEYFLYYLPFVLGAGVPLFTNDGMKHALKLISLSKVDDNVKAFYERK